MIRRPAKTEPNISILKHNNTTINTEGRLIPVCAWCDRVRDEDGHWHQLNIEPFFQSGFSLTHTICGDCKGEHFSDVKSIFAPPAHSGLSLA